MATIPLLERPACCVCGEPAVICECPDLLSGKEIVIPLVYKFEPSTPQEGLDLFATYLERHPATRAVNTRSFVSDYAKARQTVEQVKEELLHLVLHYADIGFPPIRGDVEITNPAPRQIAQHALARFLSCLWSSMTNFDFAIIRNAIPLKYPPQDTPPVGIKHAYGTTNFALDFLNNISKKRSHCLELWPPVYHSSHQQSRYTLSRPPAKASYRGLSLSEYEKFMDIMMRDEMHEARAVATACIQAWDGLSIEEAVTWKSCEKRALPGDTLEGTLIKQAASRLGTERDVYLLSLQNMLTCPVSALAILSVCTDMHEVTGLVGSGQASKMYVFHDSDNLMKPLTAKSLKRQIIKALAKMNIHIELYEVQSSLDATSARVTADKYNSKVGRKCEVSYCSTKCQAKDWKAGHKQLCGL